MNLERYEYSTNETFLDFQLESEGPNGKIRKVVRCSPQNANSITYFNLGFGDLNEETGKVDDLATSNNKDRDKILATVAATVLEFTENFPDIMVYAKGSTPQEQGYIKWVSYQTGIKYNPLLEVYGFGGGNWERFAKNVNYEAFIVLRKKL